jgi:hypothetical protein
MRLIDADKIVEQINEWLDQTGAIPLNTSYHFELLGCIEDCSTIDAVPVVRGEWIAEQKGAEYCEFRCSACDGSVGQTDQFDETEVKQFSEWYKYCPNCGAKMEDKL